MVAWNGGIEMRSDNTVSYVYFKILSPNAGKFSSTAQVLSNNLFKKCLIDQNFWTLKTVLLHLIFMQTKMCASIFFWEKNT